MRSNHIPKFQFKHIQLNGHGLNPGILNEEKNWHLKFHLVDVKMC